MFESWYGQRDEPEEETTKFWLEFRVISDGFEETHLLSDHTNGSHNDDITNTHQHFHLFPQLPAELRLKIWSYLIRPRIVLAACLSSRPSTHKPLYHKISQRPKRPYIPVLLQICSESRALALRHYELTFSWKLPHRLRDSSPYSHPHPHSHLSPFSPSLSSSNPTIPQLQPPNQPPLTNPPKVYFNYTLDTLFLLGDLEPFDSGGLNAPMVYFLRREDTSRVRHVACAFEELHLGVYDTELIFGSLFHIVDRFPSSRGVLPRGTVPTAPSRVESGPDTSNKYEEEEDVKQDQIGIRTQQPHHQFLLITTTDQDVPILPKNQRQPALPTTNNVIQKLWQAWKMGSGYWPASGGGGGFELPSSSMDSSSQDIQMVMVREEELARFVAQIQSVT